MLDFGLILEGWKNVVITDPEIEKLAEGRAAICSACPNSKTGGIRKVWFEDELTEGAICDLCKCPLVAKIRSPKDSCPVDKW